MKPTVDECFEASMKAARYCHAPRWDDGWRNVACDMRDLARKLEEELNHLRNFNTKSPDKLCK